MKTTVSFTVLAACLAVCMAGVNGPFGDRQARAIVGEMLDMHCTAYPPPCNTISAECTATLYKEVNGVNVEVPVNKTWVVWYSHRDNNTTYIYTRAEFEMEVTEESNGTYQCMVGGEMSLPFSILVCQEPALVLTSPDSHTNVTEVKVSEKCDFSGAISWLVNGHQVERESGALSRGNRLPAIQKIEDWLELTSSAECEPQSVCRVTAVFTYIWERRIRKFNRSLDIQDCCINMLDKEPTTPLQPQTSTSPISTMVSMSAKEEIWALRRDVLQWKKKVLPFQLRVLKRWSKDVPWNPQLEAATMEG